MIYHLYFADGTDRIMSAYDFDNGNFMGHVMHVKILRADDGPILLSGNVIGDKRMPRIVLTKRKKRHVRT